MRVLLASDHRYPGFRQTGIGLSPSAFPSGSGYHIHDLLMKGLVELGHEVFYLLPGADKPLPQGATLVQEPPPDAEVLHTVAYRDEALGEVVKAFGDRWVTTCHLDLTARGRPRSATTGNWIFVSRTLAQLHGRGRYVWNGIDPDDYIFSEAKDDYFLFMSTMDWGNQKGLDTVISLTQQLGFELVIAGTGKDEASIDRVTQLCRSVNATYVGDVRGRRKAELLAGATGFLFPTKVDEAFGLGMVEALMSGTPVICSDKGACPEIISSDVGFVCKDENDYFAAIRNISTISPQVCRAKAMKDFHYLRMAGDYVREYNCQMARTQ
jgi:glycosyltransferase involved in cell wall biosynthesis